MNNINQYKKRFYDLMESSMGDVKPLIDEQGLGGLIKNLFKTGTKKAPQTFKYAKEINHLIKPEIKTLISAEKPLVKFSESTAQKFYNLFWTDSKIIQKDLKSIKPFEIGLTKNGEQNFIELQRNSNKLESFIATKVGGELNIKDYVETIYAMKNQSDNLVNELLIINPKSPNLQTAKNVQTKINDILKKNDELLSKATPSKSVSNKTITQTKPVEKPVNTKVDKPQVKPEPVKTPTNTKVDKPQVKPEPVKTPTNTKVDKPQVKPEQVIPKGNFKTISIERGKYGIVTNNKTASFIDKLFEKVFYEGFDRGHNMFTKDVISKLTPESKSYLKQLKDMVESEGLLDGPQRLFSDTYGRLPKNVDEEIEMISGNIWGGGGRPGGIQLEINELPVPSSGVIENLMNVTMSSNQKNQVIEIYMKMFGG